jgi:hypothetical protein
VGVFALPLLSGDASAARRRLPQPRASRGAAESAEAAENGNGENFVVEASIRTRRDQARVQSAAARSADRGDASWMRTNCSS